MKYSISIAETTQLKHAKSNVHVMLFLRGVTLVHNLPTFCGWIDRQLARQAQENCLDIFVKGRDLIVVSGFQCICLRNLTKSVHVLLQNIHFKRI